MSKASIPRMSRRQLMIAGAGAAGALAAGSSLPLVQKTASPAATDKQAPPERGGGYQLTQHVLHYYRTARV